MKTRLLIASLSCLFAQPAAQAQSTAPSAQHAFPVRYVPGMNDQRPGEIFKDDTTKLPGLRGQAGLAELQINTMLKLMTRIEQLEARIAALETKLKDTTAARTAAAASTAPEKSTKP